MCGIAGFVLREGQAQLADVRAMCDRIRHRGPDDEGYHLDGGCAIGMRRLSIIDLSTGHQPMSNEDGSVWVVFNGEIYNYAELRDILAARGHRLVTRSDTETLVHLYEEEGADGLRRLRGMFAVAIWDARQRKLLLARDRFGKKPLYYAVLPGGLYFASELKCLRLPAIPAHLDDSALRLYFQFGYIPDPASPFRAIRKLKAGTWLEYDAHGNVREGRYWRLPPPVAEPAPGFTEAEAEARVRETFDEAVRLRLVADVPLGAFLSGGIDSSCVVAAMALASSAPVKTFSIGFEEAEFNELDYARLVAERWRTEHHEIVLRADAAALAYEMARCFDEPFADSAAIPNYLLAKFTARHVKVALTGDGGDELFAGYDSFRRVQQLAIYDRVPQALRRFVSIAAGLLPYSSYGKNYLRMISRPSALLRYFELNYAPYYVRKNLLEPEWMLPADAAFLTRTFADCLLPEDAGALAQGMYFEATANLTGDMLVKVDRTTMAHSLEARCPFLDDRLAELAAAIPHSWKIRNGRGKDILIRAMASRLPPELLQRGKHGFEPPFSVWMRGPLRDMLHDHLTAPRFLSRGIVSPGFVRKLLAEHQSGRRNNERWLWSLLMLDLWLREAEPAGRYAEAG
ncbi:MAG TPA: asparagine synthase (glutamine-hydrolyzing) [Bryobacteraceae bacterium]|nr:asparagine synthase (glutamine-hydrolyzing) [Bryobacteraceae bacterium]HOQ44249.1 asparagine synthase (glutamine-hydrolyzing) [Bryobacteraceae bacterium]HPQ13897.1 asparagine synthase (glutamine-hydrolyzing) [Bryobacteraceae bacterium]HPU70567.1 asparagine synthase (glutamine-hydrolyzing) [Bryobacteraceae bacterium]